MVNYARRHSLELPLVEEDRISTGTDALRFAELEDEDVTMRMRVIAASLVASHLGDACGGIRLDVATPLTFEWDGILALWSNYTVLDRHRAIQRGGYSIEQVIAIVEKAMNEDGQVTEIKWWWDFDNDVNVLTTPN
ncbi:hypothetical protein OF83DRAFT_1155365 [Amylostereum chailletii]|nr:hypothetical protein OF83DRAFT_1155365 [Amylostereum chailletii]